jgi:hypothetical protein
MLRAVSSLSCDFISPARNHSLCVPQVKKKNIVVSLCLSRELSNMCFEHFVLSAKDKDLRSLDAVVNN